MSASPRRVLTDTQVSWDPHANGASAHVFTRHGTVADITPGSLLEQAYGGTGNLSGIIPEAQRGNGPCLSKAAVSN